MFSEPYMNMGDTNYDDTQLNQTIYERDEEEFVNDNNINSDTSDERQGSINNLRVNMLEQQKIPSAQSPNVDEITDTEFDRQM